ncbi:MAG: nitronate monooxygenase [Spirochaetales bacterium]|nr:nitronate monooxygenase [Spirochaetales bacterium]
MKLPEIIQGGMGIGVSGWELAKEVALNGQLGVVSGTALDVMMARKLQGGDRGGHIRRALDAFPDQKMAGRILDRYFVNRGIKDRFRFKQVPRFSLNPSEELVELTVIANFVEVYLAKEGHEGQVGINLLEKIQMPNLYSLYGAMLAGVDYVIMGAGIPLEIPGIMDKLTRHEKVRLTLTVEEASPEDDFAMTFDPVSFFREFNGPLEVLPRPAFLPIVSSNVLAMVMMQKATGKVDGLIVEEHCAGGHNAPPRGKMNLSDEGEPIYGPKDGVNLDKLKELNVPFWLAGNYGDEEHFQKAREAGAAGVQVGTAFQFCRESGLAAEFKAKIMETIKKGVARVFTDPLASPTGFPFKVISFGESLSEKLDFLSRPRICDLGYLRRIYKKADGSLGYRCPAEPKEAYVAKGGKVEDTEGRKCLCNALLANISLPRMQLTGYLEKPLVTAGTCLEMMKSFIDRGMSSYSAKDVITAILGARPAVVKSR